MINYLSHCLKCGSSELEQWGESGHWWVHCHNCEHDHDDDTDVSGTRYAFWLSGE